MQRIDPLGRDVVKADTGANYDVTPYYGCYCSSDQETNSTKALQAIKPGDCMCQCSYGEANFSANYSAGYAK